MKYYFLVGEASGDIHAANLISEIKKLDSTAEFRGFGGDRMKSEGVQLTKSLSDLAFMGFVEVIANLRTILSNISICKNDILDFEPDKLILVDYPGFNMRLAKWAKKKGLEVTYYISPQIWAWKEGRVHTIKKVVDRMIVILPFEKAFYHKHQMDVHFVGHPLIDEIAQWRANNPEKSKGNKIIVLMPGSREHEISKVLPVMLNAAMQFPKTRFVIGKAGHIPLSFYQKFKLNGVEVSSEGSYALLGKANAAVVTSGTATLETALFHVPQVVCYKGNALSVQVARRLIRVKYISLVNLILNRVSVPELIQSDLNMMTVTNHLSELLADSESRKQQLSDYLELEKLLGSVGASKRAAKLIAST
jgi:lipid-A-disaccharide synthase